MTNPELFPSRTQTLGVPLSRDVGLKVDWGELATKLAELGIAGFAAVMTGGAAVSGLPALIGAVDSVRIDSPPGEKAWTLTITCFAWALDQLKSSQDIDKDQFRLSMKRAVNLAKSIIDDKRVLIPISFLENPASFSLYIAMRNSVVGDRVLYQATSEEPNDRFIARFDAAFNRAVFEILSRRSEIYGSLVALLVQSVSGPASRNLDWDTYRSKLIFDFEVEPVFGQENTKITLSQLYIPLRAYWKKNEEELTKSRIYGLSYRHNFGMLDDLLSAWLAEKDSEDYIRLVGGGPGSGKSTSLKSFARRIAILPEWRVLFVSLQNFLLEGNLKDEINKQFTDRTGGIFSNPPLSRSSAEDYPSLLIIFDGLDELAKPGEAANDVVSLFATKLSQLTNSLRGDIAKTVKVVVSGRMPAFQAALRVLGVPNEGCLQVYGYSPVNDRDQTGDAQTSDAVLELDQRIEWWQKYAALANLNQDVPEAYRSTELESITHEPLLCYLLVLSGFATGKWEDAAENTNRIYKALIDSVWERVWGEGPQRRQGPGKTLNKGDFNDLMETIALAAWQGGDTRVASEGQFFKALKMCCTEAAWENFKIDNGPDVTNLAMNFYLKASEAGQRGFEFTHKSFGDYLTARAILEIAIKLPTLADRRIDYAMSEWFEATCLGELTPEILNFLRNEVRLRMSRDVEKFSQDDLLILKRAFERLTSTALAEGFAAGSSASSWRSGEKMQRNSEAMAWAVLNCVATSLASVDRDAAMIAIVWPDRVHSFRRLISRHSESILFNRPTLFDCFSYVIARKSDLSGVSLVGVDFSFSDLQDSYFIGSTFLQADFSHTNMTGSHFDLARLHGVDFSHAVLRGCNLHDVNLFGCNFSGSDLDGLRVNWRVLLNTDYEWAEQNVAKFSYDDYSFGSHIMGGGQFDLSNEVKRLKKIQAFIKAQQKK